LIREELAERGIPCQVAHSAEQARLLIDVASPDVLVADIQMPGKSGLELLQYARSRSPACRVVLITAYSRRQYLTQAILLGAHDYIEKPFQANQIGDTVCRALASASQGPVLLDRAAEALEMDLQVRQASLESVTALVLAVEAKDPYTRRHSEQVAHYSVSLARAVGMTAAEIESVRVAALLHDIGKIGVPDQILTKPGPLTEAEFQLVCRHPALGADILSHLSAFAVEADLVRHHHERWDGRGYPDGLAGSQTPAASRVIQIADSVDAMLMERTYKSGYPVEVVLDELCRCAGTQFDPDLAAAAGRWCHANRDKLILPGDSLAKRATA
jgi:putative nucleotidyltransferase with HDIG domain